MRHIEVWSKERFDEEAKFLAEHFVERRGDRFDQQIPVVIRQASSMGCCDIVFSDHLGWCALLHEDGEEPRILEYQHLPVPVPEQPTDATAHLCARCLHSGVCWLARQLDAELEQSINRCNAFIALEL